jgi:rare lipoprotein A
MLRAILLAAALCAVASTARAETGIASVYGGRDGYCGKRVAAGGVLNCGAMTAAMCALDGCDFHRTATWLPFNTRVRVTSGNRSIIVTINDRGPFVKRRIVDLTPAAARALGCAGLCDVTVEVLR